jgi:phosphoglycolate phosphatase
MRLIVFDMDGTLIDTHALIAEHMTSTFSGLGLDVPAALEMRRVIGLSLPVAMGHLANTQDTGLIDTLVDAYKGHYRESLTHTNDREPLFPGALDALERLHIALDTELGIATGKGLAGVHRILGLHGIADYFTTMQTPDHNPSKPHPGMLIRAMSEVGVEPYETVMIGDTVFDIEMAVAAGVPSIGVSWGYHDPEDLIQAGATEMIERYDQLDGAIDRILVE